MLLGSTTVIAIITYLVTSSVSDHSFVYDTSSKNENNRDASSLQPFDYAISSEDDSGRSREESEDSSSLGQSGITPTIGLDSQKIHGECSIYPVLDIANNSGSAAIMRVARFADGFQCVYSKWVATWPVECYLGYFGFTGCRFNYCQRSIPDLMPLFDFIRTLSGCNLDNNSAKNGDLCSETGVTEEKVEGDIRGDLTRHVSPDRVNIYFKVDDPYPSPSGCVNGKYSAQQDDDGVLFPGVCFDSLNVTRDGRSANGDANFTIEINDGSGWKRLLLILTGTERMWLRLRCSPDTWLEMHATCAQRKTILSSYGHRSLVDGPSLKQSGEQGDECTLWGIGRMRGRSL